MTNQDEAVLRQEIATQYKYIESIGLNELSSGNVSCRFGDGMLISASGATGDNIEPQAIVFVSLDGKYEGDRKPSSERMPLCIHIRTIVSPCPAKKRHCRVFTTW
jgi:L-fuculose-phosphate aldolase